MTTDLLDRLDDKLIGGIADAVYTKMVGANFDLIENDLRLRLALEQRLTGSGAVPFGLDRLSTTDAGAYLGLQPETLRSTAKRRLLGLPTRTAMAGSCFGGAASLTSGWSGRGARQPPVIQSNADDDARRHTSSEKMFS